jgi:hypothetical protein
MRSWGLWCIGEGVARARGRRAAARPRRLSRTRLGAIRAGIVSRFRDGVASADRGMDLPAGCCDLGSTGHPRVPCCLQMRRLRGAGE